MSKRLCRMLAAVAASTCWAGTVVGDVAPVGDLGVERPVAEKVLIRVDLSAPEVNAALKRIVRAWDIAGTSDRGLTYDLLVTQAQRMALSAAGVPFEVVPVEVTADLRAVYHSFAELEAALAALAGTYPAITDLFSLGQSWEGRDIWCLEISDNPGVDEGEPGVQFMGLTHAREWPSMEVALDICNRLTSGYGGNPTITNLVNGRRIWVIPCVNPDGHNYSYTVYEGWRKNRRNLGGGVYGVDLNRNFDGGANGDMNGEWGSIGDGSQSHNPPQDTYLGPWPFSEPEIQAIRDFFDARDVTISVSFHTYSELVLWSWGYDGAVQTDDNALLVSIGQGMANAIGGYTPQQAAFLYPTTGASDDWTYGYRYYVLGKNTLAYTVEIGTSFHPAASQLQALLDENWNGALYVLQQAATAETQLTPFVLPPLLTTPIVDADGDFTVSWTQNNPDAGASLYELQELTGLSFLTDGAESGTGNWTNQGFSVSTARKHSGSSSFKSPSSNAVIAAMTTTDPLPVELGDQLSFWTWYDIETDWDMAFVEVSIDGRQYDVLDKFTGANGNWMQKTYSLDSYAGHSIYIRFRYTTDGAVLEEGFYVDDIYPVASWANVTTLSSAIAGTSYPLTGRSDGDYFYRVRGRNLARGFGDFCDLGMTRVYANLADSNGDGDHDLQDFQDFHLCYGGDGQPVPGTCPVVTDVFDFNLDEEIDLDDLAVFDKCLTTPGGTTPPGCPF